VNSNEEQRNPEQFQSALEKKTLRSLASQLP